uniref:Amino acid transporter transmembrane domain-containing protein n=1 Tax=Oryza punctata TaxID=4537 RepID=A0A0E0MM92_ORYPU
MVHIEPAEVSLEAGNHADAAALDDDGRPRRTGTAWTASSYIVTAVIGSGVLSLPWARGGAARVGGRAGHHGGVRRYYTSTLLAECYRTAATGRRNYSYMEAVRNILGGAKATACGVIQYTNLTGIAVGYTIAASISMLAIKRAGCFHDNGHDTACHSSRIPYMIVFAVVQIIFSQIPDFAQVWWLSIVATVMSFTYSGIGLGLAIARTVANGGFHGTLAGVAVGAAGGVTAMQKVWRTMQALGNIAFAYSFSNVLIEIVDTIKAPPPSEAEVMKKATAASIATTTAFYMMYGLMGYAAFGNAAPDNLLTGFGFYEPYWLVDVANAAIAVHLAGAYQVFVQPIFAFVERRAAAAWPDNTLVTGELRVGPFALNALRLAWRMAFVCLTTVLAMALPFFGAIVGLIGAFSFWPLSVYFPSEMYMKQRGVAPGSGKWVWLRALAAASLLVSVAAGAGSIAGFVGALKKI